MKPTADAIFNGNYRRHLQHLKRKGLQPACIALNQRVAA